MKPSLILILSFLYAGAIHAQGWMAVSPVSFYETESQQRRVANLAQSEVTKMAGFGFTGSTLNIDLQKKPPRPYGFGREPDDHSPADLDGVTRDTAYFFGYQFFIIGALYVLPESISSWSDEDKKEYTFSKWRRNISSPRWDPDDWYINYVLHPYWGLTYYTRGRERGLTEQGAFWFSFGLSSLYEFGLEALFEPVSIQDLIFTPVVGSTLGWYMEGVRREIKSQNEFSIWDKTLLIASDPLGTLNTMVDSLFDGNVESDVKFRSFYQSPVLTEGEKLGLDDPYGNRMNPVVNDYLGLELQLHWH